MTPAVTSMHEPDGLRVLLVCQPTDGGVALHVETLARSLPDHGIEATVACPPGAWAQRLRAGGVDVLAVPMTRALAPATDVAALRRLRAAAAAFDLVHTHSAKAGALGRLAARSLGMPAVHTPHAWSFLAGGQLTTAVYERIERALAASTAAIICVSAGERRRGLRVAAPDRMVVVPNGLEVPDALAAGGGGAATDPAGHEALVVGTVARLAPQKGIAYLLEAFAQVRAVRDDVRLRIAGDGPLRDSLRRAARQLGVDADVEFVGAVSSPWPVLAGLDLFVLPSLWEGLPYALLEAMATGLPSVASAVDGVTEAIPDRRYGTVVAPGDSDRLAREILALLEDPAARRAIGQRARVHVRSTFSVARMVTSTVAVYRGVLEDAARARPAGARAPNVRTAPGA